MLWYFPPSHSRGSPLRASKEALARPLAALRVPFFFALSFLLSPSPLKRPSFLSRKISGSPMSGFFTSPSPDPLFFRPLTAGALRLRLPFDPGQISPSESTLRKYPLPWAQFFRTHSSWVGSFLVHRLLLFSPRAAGLVRFGFALLLSHREKRRRCVLASPRHRFIAPLPRR